MPQMSPLSWLTIFLILSFLLTNNISILPILKHKTPLKHKIKILQNSLKW